MHNLVRSVPLLLLCATPLAAQSGAATVEHRSRAELRAAVAPAASAAGGLATSRLAERGGYSVIALRRDRTGEAEIHRDWDDVVMIQEGSAMLVHGGTVAGGRETAPGELRGGTIQGGGRRPVAAGDVVTIPAGTPHQFQLAPGQSVSYLVVKAQSRSTDPREAEVRAAVDRLFQGMRQGDSTMVRSVFHPSARLMTTATANGQPTLRSDPVDAFVRAVGTPHPEVWDERISNVQIRVDGDLATAWMDYAFFAGDRFSHCGVNAMQLVRTAEGWRILEIADTRRRERCAAAGPAPAQ